MRNIILITICVFFSAALFAQDSIFVSRTIFYYDPNYQMTDPSKKAIEEYHVMKSDTSKKIGKYFLKKLDRKVLIEGQYSDGIKTGIWNYYNFDTNELFEKYDYDKGQDIFYHSFPAQMEVKNKNGFQLDSIDSQPHLPGEEGFFVALVNGKYPAKAMQSGVSGVVYVSLQLDTTGFFSIYSIEYSPSIKASGLEDSFKQSIENTLIKLPKYIPAENNGKKVAVRFGKMPIRFAQE